MTAKINIIARSRGWNCHYCGVPTKKYYGSGYNQYRPDEATIEHVIPKSKGGTDDIENTVIACRACNTKKKNLSRVEFGLKYFAERLLNGENERASQ